MPKTRSQIASKTISAKTYQQASTQALGTGKGQPKQRRGSANIKNRKSAKAGQKINQKKDKKKKPAHDVNVILKSRTRKRKNIDEADVITPPKVSKKETKYQSEKTKKEFTTGTGKSAEENVHFKTKVKVKQASNLMTTGKRSTRKPRIVDRKSENVSCHGSGQFVQMRDDHTYCVSPEHEPSFVFQSKKCKNRKVASPQHKGGRNKQPKGGRNKPAMQNNAGGRKPNRGDRKKNNASQIVNSPRKSRRGTVNVETEKCNVDSVVVSELKKSGKVTRHPATSSRKNFKKNKNSKVDNKEICEKKSLKDSREENVGKTTLVFTNTEDLSDITHDKFTAERERTSGVKHSKNDKKTSAKKTNPMTSQDTVFLEDLNMNEKVRHKFDISLLNSGGSIYKQQTSVTPAQWLSKEMHANLDKVTKIKFSGLSDLWIEGLSFTQDGQLVIASGYSLYTYNLETMKQQVLGDDVGCGLLEGPGDVTVLDSGEIAVTDSLANDVKIYSKSTGRYLRSVAGDTSPTGITQNRQSEIIIVDNLHESQELCSVLIFSSNGELVRTIDNDGDVKYFDFPLYVATNSKDDIIVSDCIGRHISVFDTNGNFLFKCTGCPAGGSTDELKFLYPCGVCVDEDDGILLVDRYGHCVHRITQHGEYDRLVVTSSDGLVDPRSIALDIKSGLLAVGNENGTVLLFKYKRVDVI